MGSGVRAVLVLWIFVVRGVYSPRGPKGHKQKARAETLRGLKGRDSTRRGSRLQQLDKRLALGP